MKRNLVLVGLAVLAAAAFTATPAKAHDDDRGRDYGSRKSDRYYDRGYSDRGYSGGGYYDRNYSGRGNSDNGRGENCMSGRRNRRGSRNRDYRGDINRHDDHRAEQSKFTHSGRHVVDEKHGHHK